MKNNECKTLTDREQITDALTSQKQMTAAYNTFCNETATPALRSCLLSILRDEHTVAEELFNTMSTRGWYPVEQAEENKLQKAKDQFARLAKV